MAKKDQKKPVETPAVLPGAEAVGISKRGFPKYRSNPFVNTVTLHVRQQRLTVASRSSLIDPKTGEVHYTDIMKVRIVEKDQFIKIYVDQLKHFFDLSITGFKILQIMLKAYSRNHNKDRLIFNHAEAVQVAQEMGFKSLSRPTYSRGVTELIAKSFLAESDISGVFFINPKLFFNGDRVRFITELRTPEEANCTILDGKTGAVENWPGTDSIDNDASE